MEITLVCSERHGMNNLLVKQRGLEASRYLKLATVANR